MYEEIASKINPNSPEFTSQLAMQWLLFKNTVFSFKYSLSEWIALFNVAS